MALFRHLDDSQIDQKMARFGAHRPKQSRETLPVVVIVCDDAKTAPAYFDEIRQASKGRCTIRIVASPRHGATGGEVIECASSELHKLSDPQGVSVWSVVDLEMAHDSCQRAADLREQARREGVNVALSQPCFEVWILSHFISTGQRFNNCDSALKEVKKHWKLNLNQAFAQKKAQADYRKLLDKVEKAVENAKTQVPPNSQCWTEVWKIVEPLLGYLRMGQG